MSSPATSTKTTSIVLSSNGENSKAKRIANKFTREQIVLRKYVSDLFTWRKTSKAVAQGNMIHFRPDAANVYVFFRTLKGEGVMTILNGGKKDYVVDWPHFSEITATFAKKGKNIMTGEHFRQGEKIVVGPGEAVILEFK